MDTLGEQVLAFTVSESASVSQASMWFGHISAEVRGTSGCCTGCVYPRPALCLAPQGRHVPADTSLERALHSPWGQERRKGWKAGVDEHHIGAGLCFH